MSAPIFDASGWIPGAILVASLLGSPHCVGMCGGLIVAVCRNRRETIRYHLGRGIAYVLLGGLAGGLGGWVLHGALSRSLSWLSSAMMALVLIVMGMTLLRGHGFHFTLVPRKFLTRLTTSHREPAALGAISALLPCGWLHVFLLGAAASAGALSGALFMAVFWLGTLPALAAAPWLFTRALDPLSRKAPRAAALILISAGVLSLGLKVSMLLPSTSAQASHCEHMMNR